MGIPRVFLIHLYTSKSAFHFKSLQQFLSSVIVLQENFKGYVSCLGFVLNFLA